VHPDGDRVPAAREPNVHELRPIPRALETGGTRAGAIEARDLRRPRAPLARPASLLLALALAACGEPASQIRIDAANLKRDGVPMLEVDLDLVLSPRLGEALDRGVPLTLRFRLDARGQVSERHLRLRYLPLVDQFQMLDVERGDGRTFARRAQLLAGLDRVRLPLDPAWRDAADDLKLSVTLDRSTLPAALRLPALVDREWQLAGSEHRWTSAR
jgi:hypothetical protein